MPGGEKTGLERALSINMKTSGKWVRMCLYGIKYGYKIILEIKDSQEKSYLSGQTGRRKRQDRNTIRERIGGEPIGRIAIMQRQSRVASIWLDVLFISTRIWYALVWSATPQSGLSADIMRSRSPEGRTY